MKRYILLFLLSISFFNLHAQLCKGSLGDPVVNINFGNQFTQTAPLKSGITTLKYITGDCPVDGNYTITSTSYNCFGATWHNFNNDHTGDPGGKLMLINASVTPNDFYLDTVKGLCGNTIYEFGAWVSNMLKPSACSGNGSKPNLTFSIETLTGTVLGTYNTGAIAENSSMSWKQYGFFFQPDINTTAVVLRITNNAPGNCGNDLAIDDITFRPCGPKIDGNVQGYGISDVKICVEKQPDFIFKTTVGTGYINPVFQWQLSLDTGKTWLDIPNATNLEYQRTPTKTGYYQYRLMAGENMNVANPQCRTSSNIIFIKINGIDHSNNIPILQGCEGSAIQMNTNNSSDYQYSWIGPNGFSSNSSSPKIDTLQLSHGGNYIVQIHTPDNCSETDTLQLVIYPKITAAVSSNKSILCENEQALLTATGGTNYSWTPTTGLSNPSSSITNASPTDTIIYKVLVADIHNCKDSANITIIKITQPRVDAGKDKAIFKGNSVVLDGQIQGPYSNFFWTPYTANSSTPLITPTVSPTITTRYYLTVSAAPNCATILDSVLVTVYEKIEPPNAFSPNGDGINDTWQIPGISSYPNATLSIFNRQGEMIYHSSSYKNDWDGKLKGVILPFGIYYYLIIPGVNFNPVFGSILLVR